ncbi:MAG: peptidylprolyl isomerase [Myxococcales bacterium]|nr:peptidylprolyl isomerase [Myxococcales bacterium]
MRVPLLLVPLALALAVTGCPRPGVTGEPRPDDRPLTREDRLQVARLEAQRDAAVPRLIELTRDPSVARRALALRALGRIGSPAAVAALRAALAGDAAVAASAALGVAGATGALEPDVAAAITAELAKVTAGGADRATVIEALGRIAHPTAAATVGGALGSRDREVAVAAGIALGRLGRAQVPLDESTELAAIGRSRDDDPDVRFAATYALARAHIPASTPPPAATDPVVRALRDRLTDPEPLVRATAITGLAARRAVPVTTPALLDRLDDSDWRVAVELVRALGGPAGTPETRKALVAFLARIASEWAAGRMSAPFAHVLLEGLRQLPARASDPRVRGLLVSIARSYADEPPGRRPPALQLASAWASCLALAALARPLPETPPGDALGDPEVARAQLDGCGAGLVPEAEVRKLVLDVSAERGGADAVRRLALSAGHGDVRIAAHAVGLLPGLWTPASHGERILLADALAGAVARAEAAVAGAAAEASGPLLAEHGQAGPLASVATAVVDRLAAGGDPELVTALLGAIARARLDALPACQALRTDPSPPVRAAARTCVTALVGEDPGPATAAAAAVAPPLDPLVALGGARTWRLTTTQGEVAIALAGDLAPWHVAAIITLTRSGFYDGLTFHRVVPGFVIQGGDPTGSGWGGPGYTLPAEPGSRLDAPVPAYGPGAVGVADAGKDSGGSQWFVMHGRAPHLDGRYTWIGAVTEGADVFDRLLQGDRVIRARVEP